MTRFLLTTLSILFCSGLFAQEENVLLLTNPQTNETNTFREGSFIVFELKADNTMHEGFIQAIKDSALVLEDSQVSLSQIKILAGSSKARVSSGKVAHILGNTLLLAGMTVFDCGLDLMFYNDFYYWPIGGTIWVAGAFMAGLGHVFDWAAPSPERSVRVRNYRAWEAQILSSGQKRLTEQENIQAADSTLVPKAPVPANNNKKFLEDDVYGD